MSLKNEMFACTGELESECHDCKRKNTEACWKVEFNKPEFKKALRKRLQELEGTS